MNSSSVKNVNSNSINKGSKGPPLLFPNVTIGNKASKVATKFNALVRSKISGFVRYLKARGGLGICLDYSERKR